MSNLEDIEDSLGFYEEEQNEKFLKHCIQPVENAVRHLPKIFIFDSTILSVSNVSNVKVPGISKLDSDIIVHDFVAIMTLKGELLALGEALMNSEEIMKEERGIAVRVNKVFIS